MGALRTGFSLILWVLVIALLYVGAMRLRSVDPLADYREALREAADTPFGLTMHNATLAAYDGPRPILRVDTEVIEVTRDEREVWLRNCTNGRLFDEGKEAGQFEAASVRYDDFRKTASVSNVRLIMGDLDVRTQTANWTEADGRVAVPTPIVGTLAGGKVEGQSAEVFLRTRTAEVSVGKWEGLLAYRTPLQERQSDKRRVVFRFHSVKKTAKPNVTIYTNAEMVDDKDTFVRADRIVHDLDTDIATCEGRCQMRSPRMDITADKAVVDLNVKRATLTQNVTMTIWPKPEDVAAAKEPPKEGEEQEDPLHSRKIAKGYPVRATCDRLVYLYGEEQRSELEGSLKARQDLPEGRWREVTARRAVIDEKAETLRLDGDVRMIASNGDDLTVEWIVLSIKEDEEEEFETGPGSGVSELPEKVRREIPDSDKPR